MSKRLRLLLNIGTADATKLGLKETREGKVVSVGDDVGKILTDHGWAAPEGEAAPVPVAPRAGRQASNAPSGLNLPTDTKIVGAADSGGTVEEVTDADTSPVSGDNADEAIDQIGRMRSREKLQSIVDSDPRTTVKNAARERLRAL